MGPHLDGLSRPIRRDPLSREACDDAAKRIAERIQPASVLVVGCGLGLLVEGLRSRRVAAFGVDPDESLLDQASPHIRPYLTRAAYPDDLPDERYSLIVVVENLNDLPPETAAALVRNLCRRSEDIIFSALFAEDGDAEGRADRPPGYWAGLFADSGFFRDPAFDSSSIAPLAARYRLRPDLSRTEVVQEYENRIHPLLRENTKLQARVGTQEQAIESTRMEHDAMVETMAARLRHWEFLMADLESSLGWKMLRQVRLLRMRLAPPGSRRAALLRVIRDSIVSFQEEGPGASLRRLPRGLASLDLRVSPGVKTIEQINVETYPDFVRRTMPAREDLERQQAGSRTWEHRPLISFVMPVYRPPPEVLRAALDSVLAQTYDRWELCVADASAEVPEIRQLLESYTERDGRIRLRFLDENLGITGNGNAAIEMATGEYIAILDHDDVLAPNMLFEVVSRIKDDDLVDVIYFDEDKLSEDGLHRRDPFFKPDFSPEMLLSANYLTHAVFRRSLVEAAGRYDLAYEGCQDWDLALKITENTNRIAHIPKVLYHWRQVSGSTAGDFSAKSYVFQRQLRCVEAHLRRKGLPEVRASFPVPGFLRVKWPVPGDRVSIVIPTRDKLAYLKRTIKSLKQRTDYPAFEIIVVDNDSRSVRTLRYLDRLRRTPDVRVVDYKETFNYSRANNLGARYAEGEYLLFLNNDVEILNADWLEEMVRWAERPGVGIVGGKLVYPDDTIQHAGVVVGLEGHASHVFWGYRDRQSGPFGSVDWYRNFSAVTGACMMMPRGIFEQVGGFDEKYVLAFSDIEICLRTVQHGYRIVYTPYGRLRHFEGKSRGDHIPAQDIQAGIEDFSALIEDGDPFFNPNLSYAERQPMIRPANEEDRISRLLRVTALARINEIVSS